MLRFKNGVPLARHTLSKSLAAKLLGPWKMGAMGRKTVITGAMGRKTL